MKRRKPLNLEGLCSMRIDDEESPDLEIVRPDRNNYSTTSSPSSHVLACLPDEDGPPAVSTLKDFQLDEKIETYRKLDHSMRMRDGNRKLKLHLQEFEDEKKRRRSQNQTGIQVQVIEDTNVSSRPDLVRGTQLSLDSEFTVSGVRLSSPSQQQSRPVRDKDCCMVAFELNTDKVILSSSPPAHANGNEVSHIHDLEQSPSSRNCKVCPLCQNKSPASKRPIQANGEDDQILCTKCRGIPISSPARDTTPVNCKPQREQHCDSPRLISGRSLGVMKRSHQAIGDTPDTALELSDDEENPKGVVAQRGDLPNRKQLRSALKKRRAGAKVLYPSSHDPEAVEVRYADLEHLAPSEFLNDTVIDFYIKYIQINYFSEQEEKLQRFHFFTCFFYKKLTSGKKAKGNDCFENLHKWTKGINIFEKSYLLMPIHDSSHWSLAIICFPRGQKVPYILHLDSIPKAGHSSEDIYKMLKSYLEVERRRLLQENHDAEDITEVEPSKAICRRVTVPLQKNDWDCGLFMLYYIELFVQQVPAYCDSTHLEKMFGQKWFKPKEASELRGVILQLLDSIFDQRYRCIATTLVMEEGLDASFGKCLLLEHDCT